MSPDNIDKISLNLHDFLNDKLDCSLDDNEDYIALHFWLVGAFEQFYTKDSNYN